MIQHKDKRTPTQPSPYPALLAAPPQNRNRPRPSSRPRSSGGGRPSTPARRESPAPDSNGRQTPAPPAPPERPTRIEIPEVISVRDLAKAMGANAIDIIKTLMSLGTMANINELIDFDAAAIVGEELGIEVVRETIAEPEVEAGSEGPKTLRERLIEMEDDPTKLSPRPPVVTILGHVDHGKTTLLDVIRNTNVVARESGGITQHIGAYQVEMDGRKITFLDTPGHAAFTAMRARGAQATDIAILVVAADDGVMPQTREAIAHARAARVPIVVAVNKVDKANANIDRVKQQLADLGLQADDWGGDTTVVPISAKKKLNIEELLENVLLVADVMDLRANPEGAAIGTVIEANQDKHLGNVATVLVQKGALHAGDPVVIGQDWGHIRAMFDDAGRPIATALPAAPVLITGLQGVPSPGDIFQVVENDRLARQIASERSQKARAASQETKVTLSLDDLYRQIQSGDIKELNLIIKVDVQGSLEPIENSLQDLSNEEVKVRILHQDVGAITDSDIMLAAASRALVLGFHTTVDAAARRNAEQNGVDIRVYNVIYEMVDDISKALKGMLEPVYEDRLIGKAEVRAVFQIKGRGKVLGCLVVDGIVKRDAPARVLRQGKEIHRGKITSLKRYQDDVPEIRAGYECGLSIADFDTPAEGDLVEALERVRVR
jgi:translation initiation factor IF-2